MLGMSLLTAVAISSVDMQDIETYTQEQYGIESSVMNFTPQDLPSTTYSVLDYGLVGDGETDDSAALTALASNTEITNWYFPEGYTFLLMDINPPSHITHIWGGGRIRQFDDGNTDTGVYIYGAFSLWRNGAITNPNLVIDGLTFDDTGAVSSTGSGILYFSKDIPANTTINQIEVRNCTFENNGYFDGIKLFSKIEENRYHENIKIHHNLFTGTGGYFPLEVGNNTGGVQGDCFPGFEFVLNKFSNAGSHGCISIILTAATDMKIHNNYSTSGSGYWIELAESSGIEVYNNTVLTHDGNPVNEGGNTWQTATDPTKGNNIHHNHFEIIESVDHFIHLFGGSSLTLFENNYIKGHVRIAPAFNLISGQDCDFGILQNNTIVHLDNHYSNYGLELMDYDGTEIIGGSIITNEIYVVSGETGLQLTTNISEEVTISGNNTYTTTPPESLTDAGISVLVDETGPT